MSFYSKQIFPLAIFSFYSAWKLNIFFFWFEVASVLSRPSCLNNYFKYHKTLWDMERVICQCFFPPFFSKKAFLTWSELVAVLIWQCQICVLVIWFCFWHFTLMREFISQIILLANIFSSNLMYLNCFTCIITFPQNILWDRYGYYFHLFYLLTDWILKF